MREAGAAAAPQPLELRARDGRVLCGLITAAQEPRGGLVVNGATGYRREFYLKFAAYCAARGYHTLVYDYRGMGASAHGPASAEPARMSDWGLLDMPAALAALAARCAPLPLVTLGHSVGGQLLGCLPDQSLARAHVLIACSTGYWRRQSLAFRGVALLLWKVYGPLELALRGYIPNGLIWSGGDLPPGVFLQWRSWCMSAAPFGPELDAALADSHYEAVTAPLLAWGFSDDPIATPAAITALLASYSHARIERRTSTPRAAGVRRIGHHGFFAERHRGTLWRETLDWIDAQCA